MIIVLFCYLAIRGENGWDFSRPVRHRFLYLCYRFRICGMYAKTGRKQCETGAKMVEGFGLGPFFFSRENGLRVCNSQAQFTFLKKPSPSPNPRVAAAACGLP
jgi:hypothetical protein